MAITGIVLFAYVDGFESASFVGVALSVGAAIGAACYKVCTLIKATLNNNKLVSCLITPYVCAQ